MGQRDMSTFTSIPRSDWRPHTPAYDPSEQFAFCVVHFWAEWNRIDRDMDTALSQLSASLDPSLPLRSCDIDAEPELSQRANVTNVPALALFVAGAPVDLVTGFGPFERVRATLDRYWHRVAAI